MRLRSPTPTNRGYICDVRWLTDDGDPYGEPEATVWGPTAADAEQSAAQLAEKLERLYPYDQLEAGEPEAVP